MGDNKKYKEQLYPNPKDIHNNDYNKRPWDYKKEQDALRPSVSDVNQIYSLMNMLIKHNLQSKNITSADDSVKKLLREVYSENVNEKDKISNINFENETVDIKEIEVDIIKGSIYKIKKYFLENNNLKDIRGGSMMIDHLNITEVKNIMDNQGFTSENIIYCGGGNIFIVVPKGKGEALCEVFEKEFTRISLTVMSAFESISCSLYDLLFNFTSIKSKIETKVTERSKMKIYEIDPDPDKSEEKAKLYGCKEIKLRNLKEEIKFKLYPKANKEVCELCHTRDAKFLINDESEELNVCNSCLRKHIVGKKKSTFIDEYKDYVRKFKKDNYQMEHDDIGSIDEIGSEIAVIYGDGNNMGNVVKKITNIFEMMYFSRITDERVKAAVYESLYEVMGSEAKFEVLGLGGDDIFIIVPAVHAFEISTKIIDKFDKAFNKQITMSVGIAIAKSATPVTSLFSLAQSKLKSAKKLVRKYKLQEGSIDVIELIGDMHSGSQQEKLIVDNYKIEEKESLENKRVFPLSNSDFKRCISNVQKIKGKVRTQLYKIGYAKENMMKEEFELFFFYQNSKQKKSKNTEDISNIYDLIKVLNKSCKYAGDKFNKADPYSINWNELILLYERGVESGNGK